jgi:hypothetical protein
MEINTKFKILIVGFIILLRVFTESNILCSLFTTSTYTTCFGPSWWPSSSVTIITYKGCSLLPTDLFESGLVSVVYLHNIKLYVNINK